PPRQRGAAVCAGRVFRRILGVTSRTAHPIRPWSVVRGPLLRVLYRQRTADNGQQTFEGAMRHYPTFEHFAELARDASLVPVYRQLLSDSLTPVSAFCKIQEGDWSFLFESVVGGEKVGRYSFLGAGPFLRFEAFGNRVVTREAGRRAPTETRHDDPLLLLEEKLAAYRAPHVPGLPRFCGGAVGYA